MKASKFNFPMRLHESKRTVSVMAAAGILALLVLVAIGSVQAAGADEAEKSLGPIGFIFKFLDDNPIVFLFIALAIGYPLGRVAIGGISLGATAGTLLVGVLISLTAKVGFDITYSIPGILSSIFLMMFMYALGLRVGPQFFSGLRSGGAAFIVIALTVWILNWIICFGGVKIAGLDPGFAPGIISGSYTITAILGVAGSAISSGAYAVPEGMTGDQIGANMAAGYAIAYLISSVFTILVLRYCPAIFGRDPVADAKEAEAAMSGGTDAPVPGAHGSLAVGFSQFDLRAFTVEHEEFVGKTVEQLFKEYPDGPILRVVRNGEAIEATENPTIQKGDIIAVRGDIGDLIEKGEKIVGPESTDPQARNVPIEAADIRVGSKEVAGKTLAELAKTIGHGLELKAMFRMGEGLPILPEEQVGVGDVLRLVGPVFCIEKAAKELGGRPILDNMVTEVMYMAIAMAIGYIVGKLSVTLGGIPFALGTSAGCLLAGIFMSYFRSRNPEFGGPVSEGARLHLQDIGLNMFVAVLAANVGPKVLSSFQGPIVIWIAIIGACGALIPPFVAFIVGHKMFKLNSVIAAGAAAGGRNHTPSLNAVCEESQSAVAAVPYPLTYAITTVTALVGGYLAMMLS